MSDANGLKCRVWINKPDIQEKIIMYPPIFPWITKEEKMHFSIISISRLLEEDVLRLLLNEEFILAM